VSEFIEYSLVFNTLPFEDVAQRSLGGRSDRKLC